MKNRAIEARLYAVLAAYSTAQSEHFRKLMYLYEDAMIFHQEKGREFEDLSRELRSSPKLTPVAY